MEKLTRLDRRKFLSGNVHQEQVLRLPWVISASDFEMQCTKCQACVAACETEIIVLDEQGYPKVEFSKGECTFCQKCIQSCPEPLFSIPKKPISPDRLHHYPPPWLIELNISEQCLAKNNIYCQSCRDECEVNAIKFAYVFSGKVNPIPRPAIYLTDCNQCGACISSCPQDAISIDFLS